jgi:phosphoglycerol transferase
MQLTPSSTQSLHHHLRKFRQTEISRLIVLLPALFITWQLLSSLYGEGRSYLSIGRDALYVLLLVLPFLSWKQGHNRNKEYKMLVILTIVSLPMFVFFAIDMFIGRLDLDAIIYHLQFGVPGYDPGMAYPVVGILSALWLVFVLSVANYAMRGKFAKFVVVTMVLTYLAVNPMMHSLAKTLAYKSGLQAVPRIVDLVEKYAEAKISATAKPQKNIIYIYLEGLERTYGDVAAFGDSYGPIAALARQGVELTNVDQTASTGWSIAGMVASQCGIPLFRYGIFSHNDFNKTDAFLPNISCLSDLLSRADYRQEFVTGADWQYAGVGKFLSEHSFDDYFGLTKLGKDTPHDRQKWGLHDGVVFKAARKRLLLLEKTGKPYHLAIQTIGPHGPMGFLSKKCRSNPAISKTDDILEAVKCLADLTREFVDFVRANVDREKTIIVLSSDHLAHLNNVTSLLDARKRRNTVILLDGGLQPAVISKAATMIDVYPTLLEALGFELKNHRAGLGVSLLSNLPTLRQLLGKQGLHDSIQYDNALASHVWKKQPGPD